LISDLNSSLTEVVITDKNIKVQVVVDEGFLPLILATSKGLILELENLQKSTFPRFSIGTYNG
ncbi:11004_t:CDS:1, partial [Entrophospora sp. SA101]